jgi:crossover junction endodeoxyribonuclease RuvC
MTTLRLGYTFGALLATFASMKIPIFKYPTKIVKQLIANKGSSSKDDVEKRVMEILNISNIDNQDSSDALAVAITYVFEKRRNLEVI